MNVADIDEKFLKKAGLSDNEQKVYTYYLGLPSAGKHRDWVRNIGATKFGSFLESAENKVQKALRSGK